MRVPGSLPCRRPTAYNWRMTSHAVSAESNTVTVAVELPKQALELLGLTPEEAAVYLKKLALIELFRRDEVSSGWAAERLGMSKWDFIQLLGAHKVPYIDLTEEELRQEVEVALSHWGRRESPPSQTADR